MHKLPERTYPSTYTLSLSDIGIISQAAVDWNCKNSEAIRRIIREWAYMTENRKAEEELTPES
jgi:hypothetical protein